VCYEHFFFVIAPLLVFGQQQPGACARRGAVAGDEPGARPTGPPRMQDRRLVSMPVAPVGQKGSVTRRRGDRIRDDGKARPEEEPSRRGPRPTGRYCGCGRRGCGSVRCDDTRRAPEAREEGRSGAVEPAGHRLALRLRSRCGRTATGSTLATSRDYPLWSRRLQPLMRIRRCRYQPLQART
jgi:hypothetical protein